MTVPILNVYYLLCYAWRHAEESDVVAAHELQGVEHVHDLLGKVLAEGTFQVVRRGLDRGYREVREDLAGIRGKLDLGETTKRALRSKGRAACVFEELSHDVLHNQIIRSTLGTLLRFPALHPRVRDRVRGAYLALDGVRPVHIDRAAFRRVQLDRNRRRYRFLLAVCLLLHDSSLVDERNGEVQFRDLRENIRRMWQVFEDFVREFYSREQSRYSVNRDGRRIDWRDSGAALDQDRALIPLMEADVLLDSSDRRIIVDTKFYEEALVEHWGARKLRSTSLYQLLAYLRNREATLPSGPRHEGILLYPVVDHPLAVDIRLEGHRIQARGIDLAQDWERIHRDMLAVIDA